MEVRTEMDYYSDNCHTEVTRLLLQMDNADDDDIHEMLVQENAYCSLHNVDDLRRQLGDDSNDEQEDGQDDVVDYDELDTCCYTPY